MTPPLLTPVSFIFLFALFLVFTPSSVSAQCPSGTLIEDPTEFQWTYHPVSATNPEAYYSGTMEVGEASFLIGGETLTTRAYRQLGGSYGIPGPTIRLSPGNKYVLRFHNTLPYEAPSPDHNVFKDPNISNIHTHGLHISGESPGDDVTRYFEGGRGGDFVYDIPADHMGGTYWYHAHHHGSSFLQVSGGMFGMMIVDDGNDGIPASVAAMPERNLVFGFLDPGAAGTGGDQLMSGTLSPTWTVNGKVDGTICTPPDSWQHWRVLLADRNANMKTLEFGPNTEVMLLARDGVWRTVAPKAITSNTLELTGASRADFAVRTTSGDSWIKIGGTTVATISTEGSPDPSGYPFDADGVSTWSANRPAYLRDLRGETDVHNESISMGARTVNGRKYDHHDPNISLTPDRVQEWDLSGALQHPFHLHIYHVQALADDGDFEAGEYYDVVSAKISVRFDLNAATSTPYDGRTIMHCHILSHEDRGAMGWLDVLGGAGPPTFPSDTEVERPYADYYFLDGMPNPPAAPTGLMATAVSSSAIDLIWTDNATDEDGFIIERSLDGSSFAALATVGSDVAAYSDAGLSASTTYHYRVTAFNTAGNSDASNVASATTQSGGGGATLHVQDISITRESAGRNRFRAVATITVFDDGGSAVAGVTVDGNFSGPTSGGESGTTDANGQVTFISRAARSPVDSWCFEVTNLSQAGSTYDPSSNLATIACETSSAALINPVEGQVPESLSDGMFPHPFRIFPNPARTRTEITFELALGGSVRLEVYSLLGKRMAVITDRLFVAGLHRIGFNTGQLPSGTYYLRLDANGTIKTRKMLVAATN